MNWNYGYLGRDENVPINTTKGAQQIYGNNGNTITFGTNWFNDPVDDNSVTNTQELFYGFPSDNSNIIGINSFTLKGKIENKTITENGTYYPSDSSTIIKKITVNVPEPTPTTGYTIDTLKVEPSSTSSIESQLIKIEKTSDIPSKRSRFYIIWKMNNRNEIQIRFAMIRNNSNSSIPINNFVFRDNLPDWNIIPSQTVFGQGTLLFGQWGKPTFIQFNTTKDSLGIDDDEESWKFIKTLGQASYSIINNTTNLQNQINIANLIYNTYFTGVKSYDQNLNETNIPLSNFTPVSENQFNYEYQNGDLLLLIQVDKDIGWNDLTYLRYYRKNFQLTQSQINTFNFYYYVVNESNSIITDFCFYNNKYNSTTHQIYNPDSIVFDNTYGEFSFYNELRF